MISIRIAHGSAIVVIKNGNEVFIGADSKVKNSRELTCKIRQVNNLFFGLTHYVEIVHPLMGIKIFDAFELATKTGTIKGKIRDKVDYFDKLVEGKLTEVLKIWSSTFSKDEIREIMFGKNELMRAVIIGIENNKPIILERFYSVDNFDVIPLRIKTDIPQDINKDNAFVISMGIDTAIDQDIQDIKRNKRDRDILLNPIKSINRLITLQASATPDVVGPPIDILRIAPGNVGWIQHKQKCHEIKTEFFKKPKKIIYFSN